MSTAYRATFEEQDDTVLWFTQVLRGAGADLALLLQGSAVSYAVAEQDPSGLAFGAWRQAQPPNIAGALVALLNGGVAVAVSCRGAAAAEATACPVCHRR